MTTNANMTSVATSSGLIDRLFASLNDYRANAARRKTYRDTLRELRALSNRDLEDLGLNRSMLKRIAYQAAFEA